MSQRYNSHKPLSMFERFTKTAAAPSPREQSTRNYQESPELLIIGKIEPIIEQLITPDSHVLVIGDGQGLDTRRLLISNRVSPKNIHSVNYDPSEVDQANKLTLKEWPVRMSQGDATSLSSLHSIGVEETSKDIVIMMHVLEVPAIRGDAEKALVENIARILKPDGEALITQYIRRLTPEQAREIGVQEIRKQDLVRKYGATWEKDFEKETGKTWHPGMRFSELSNVRTKDELVKLFEKRFIVRIDESRDSYVIRLKKKLTDE